MILQTGSAPGLRVRVRCRVGICGELAADESLTQTFLRLGVDELSVSPPRILPLRRAIRDMTLA